MAVEGDGPEFSGETAAKETTREPPAAAAASGGTCVAVKSIPFSGGMMMFGGASNSDLAHAGDLGGRRFLRINGGILLPDKHGARP